MILGKKNVSVYDLVSGKSQHERVGAVGVPVTRREALEMLDTRGRHDNEPL